MDKYYVDFANKIYYEAMYSMCAGFCIPRAYKIPDFYFNFFSFETAPHLTSSRVRRVIKTTQILCQLLCFLTLGRD